MEKKKQTRLEGYGMSSVVGSVILGPSFVGFIHSILPFKIYILSSFLCSIEIEWADSGLGKSANGISVRRATTQNPQKGGKRQEENFQGKLQEENFQGNFQHENFQAMGLAKGMEVRREGGRIVFVGCEDVVIDLLAVEPWIPRLCIPVHVDQYQQYAASADFVVSCLAIKLTNESTKQKDNIGLGPLVILANYGNTDTNANTLKGNSEQALTKAVQQEWRLKLLINLHKILLAIIYNENERQIITAVANIFEIGEITHPVLVGLCASLWGLGYSGTSLLNASVREIINKTGKQVFVAEAEVIMGLQGNFSERIHQTLQMILQGPESVQPLVQNNEKYNFGYILGVCIGLKALCNKEDSWLKGIVSYINSEEEEENTERNGNRVSMVPKFFSHSSSWRKLLNL